MNRLSEDDIAAIRQRLQPLQQAEERARRYLNSEPAADRFFAVTGVSIEDTTVTVDSAINIRASSVTAPPGVIHICRAAQLNKLDYLGVARCAQAVRGQLAFTFPDALRANWLEHAWHFIALVKLRATSSLRCPAVATRSWNTIPAISDNSVEFNLLDDVSGIHLKTAPISITADDLGWAAAHYSGAYQLRDHSESRRFGLAFHLAYTWNYSRDIRTCLGNLWMGLEALFGDRTDMKKSKGDPRNYSEKLADKIAEWVGSAEAGEVRYLYDRRCDALHGRWMEIEHLEKAVLGSQELLRQSLVLAIECGQKTLPDWRSTL